jgi:hypothetical protein
MKVNPAGAGCDDDPGAVWAAAGVTRLSDLSSYPSPVAVHKSFSGRRETADLTVLDRETPVCYSLGLKEQVRASAHNFTGGVDG